MDFTKNDLKDDYPQRNMDIINNLSEFLSAFTGEENETINLRTFGAKGFNNVVPKTYTTTSLGINKSLAEKLETENKKSGVYFVVNSGGNTDVEICRYNAFFVENDNLTIQEQHQSLDTAPIQPSIRVETQKSVHAYWLVNRECLEDDWREVQARLIQYFDGDNKIKNPSRCMRLPFYNHVSFDGNMPQYKKVEVTAFDSDKRFTVDEMKDAFPEVEVIEAPKTLKSVTTVTTVTTSDQKFETWNELNAELGLRIIQNSNKVRSNGNYQIKCPVHNGQSDDSLFFDPSTKVICCTKGCEHSLILSAFGLPTKPDFFKEPKENQSALILKIMKDLEFFVNQEDMPFVCINVNGHQENWAIDSKNFKEYISRNFYKKYQQVPSEISIKEALGTLAGKAKYEGEKKQVYIRRAEYDGAIYLDLANEDHQVIKIEAGKWEIISNCPVKFKRVGGLKPLPIPERNGSLTELDKFLNVRDEDLYLIKAWLITALKMNIPCPILVFSGQQNCGKSTSAKVLCELIDPNVAELLGKPKNEEGLFITANNRLIVPLDNISYIDEDLSDTLCKICTGSSVVKRKIYTDAEEIILKAKNPIMITGIGDIATREDFLSRCIILDLPVLKTRLDETSFWKEFYQALPRIFGALLDAVSESLRNLDFINLTDNELRMLDFARLGTSIENCLGLDENEFIEIYRNNYNNIRRLILDNNIVVSLLIKFMKDKPEWIGTASELYDKLDGLTNYSNQKKFPKSATGLSNALERLGKNLSAEGIEIERDREGGTGRRLIQIINLNLKSSQSSHPSQNSQQELALKL